MVRKITSNSKKAALKGGVLNPADLDKYSICLTTKTLLFAGQPRAIGSFIVNRTDRPEVKGVIIPNSVKVIDWQAFKDCKTLASAHIPNSVFTIDRDAFQNCASLAVIHIPNSISTLAQGSFALCTSLASVHIPNSLSKIEAWTFWRCANLASVRIPPAVSTINTEAFYGCSSLSSIHIPNGTSVIEGLAFYNCPRLHKACIPTSAKIVTTDNHTSFQPQTCIFRNHLKPITALQKKSAYHTSKATYSIYL